MEIAEQQKMCTVNLIIVPDKVFRIFHVTACWLLLSSAGFHVKLMNKILKYKFIFPSYTVSCHVSKPHSLKHAILYLGVLESEELKLPF